MVRGKKRQVCVRIEESILKEMEQIKDKTGLPVSRQIELRLKGFTISSAPEKGNAKDILQMFSSWDKDEEFADNIDLAVESMRRGLKLH